MTNAPAAPYHDVARRLLPLRDVASRDLDGLASDVDRKTRELCGHLARVLGAAGCQALIARALRMSETRYAFFGSVHLGAEGLGSLDGLGESMLSVDPTHAIDGLTTFLATVIWLLDTFIGEKLTRRMLIDLWPNITAEDLGAFGQEGQV